MVRDPNDSSDCIVHEVFRGLEEVALTSAYVLERDNGEIVSWNCRVEAGDGPLVAVPAEDVVSAVHFNLRRGRDVRVQYENGMAAGRNGRMEWVKKAGSDGGFWPPDTT